ncbi:MAG: endopeptidase La [Succinivibrio sp.]|nr:endopeptidase La [Succinivibrio sp.]
MSQDEKKKDDQTVRQLKLPLVTLRGLTITPNAKLQITAARKSSVEAFRQASTTADHLLAVFCQKNEQDENPDQSALHPVGVLCKELSFTEQGNGTYQILIDGSSRLRLVTISQEDGCPYRHALVDVLVEPKIDERVISNNLEVLKSSLDYAIENQARNSKSIIDSHVPDKVLKQLKLDNSLTRITDQLAQVLKLDHETKLMLLSNNNPLERAQILISTLNGYSYKSELEGRIVDEAKAAMERNQKEYFLHEQIKAIRRELGTEENSDMEVEEFKARDAALKAPEAVHKRIQREIKKFAAMSSNSSESAVIRSYIESLLSVPWESKSKINHDLKKAQEILENEHYGLNKVKDRILEYLAVQNKSEKLHGPILCLMGPPGIGKTSLGQSIARATGRKYVRFALGGLHDEAEIRGHRRTYVGALPGRIIQNMIKVGVNNPLFLLDEIDKVTDSIHGDPASALLEVLDPEQNNTFEDNYIELEYDLSNVMFVTTANSYNISAPLLDRMEVIDLSSYTEEEKFNIARKHLLPKQLRVNNLKSDEFDITDAAITELIRYYTHESGVRGLERLLNEICRKSIKEAMLTTQEQKPKSRSRKIPSRVIEVSDLGKMLGPRRFDFTSKLKDNKVGLVNGLAWTAMGGDILQIEAVANRGKGKHQLTGKLGDVMKESISAAITLVRSQAEQLHLDESFFERCDLHIHVPEGATPKEGPSAGIGMVTSVVSALTGNPVRADVAMTGEITLRGDVLPIGGLKEKLLAALRGGIKVALIPQDNEKDLWDIPEKVKKGLDIKPVKRIEEVLKVALVNDPETFVPVTAWRRKESRKDKKVPAVVPEAQA